MVTLENYEEYILLYVDDEISVEEKKALIDFLEQHPELKKELAYFEKTKLSLPSDITFADKEKLMKGGTKTVAWKKWLTYAIAASLALLITLSVEKKWFSQSTNEAPEIVTNKVDSTSMLASKAVENDSVEDTTSPPVVSKKYPLVNTVAKKLSTTKNVDNKNPFPNIIQPDTIAPKNPIYHEEEQPIAAEVIKETIEEKLPDPISNVDTPSAENKKIRRKGLFALLSVSSEKQRGLKHLKNTVEEKIESVKNIQEELKNTSVEIKFGNKELLVLNF